jgi:hypothetical protein
MSRRLPHLALLMGATLAFGASPAFAASGTKPAGGTETDEKLPAQLPSVTIQGQDLSNANDRGNKIAPSAAGTSRIRLPEPPQRRATRDNNKALMVDVTPSTLEAPSALPGSRLPYTSLLGGYGPLTQYRLGIYDARTWGPVLGITDLSGHAGWDWSGWHAQEDLDWTAIGRAEFTATGFAWGKSVNHGNQTYFQGVLDHDAGQGFSIGLDGDRGTLGAIHSGVADTDLNAQVGRVRGRWQPTVSGEHQPQVDLTGQYRQWGIQSGAESYLSVSDFWSLSDQVQLQGGLGGGYWGREPILDPQVTFHYRPAPATHLYVGLKTASELPDFASLYLQRPATAAATDLQAERVEGWATMGGSHRLSDALWGSLDFGFRRSFRHIYWADSQNTGLWTPTNAAMQQWMPTGAARLQYQWTDGPSIELGYAGLAVYPLGNTEHTADAKMDLHLLDQRLGVSLGVDARYAALSAAQLPGGGTALGAFAKAQITYQLTPDWSVGVHAADVPLTLDPTGATYFAPNPWLTLDAQYQF